MFPDQNTPNLLFGGVKFLDVPICHIKSSRNNTILQVTKPDGKVLILYSNKICVNILLIKYLGRYLINIFKF